LREWLGPLPGLGANARSPSRPAAQPRAVSALSRSNRLFDSYLAKTKILIMIFLIGGPPRVGKSRISSEIRQKHAVSVVSTDTLGAVLEHVLSPEAAPDLFVFGTFHDMPMAEQVKFIMKDPAALIAYVRKESSVVWNAVEAFIRREHDEGRDVLIEGVAVLPELMSQLEDIPHRVVFIGISRNLLKGMHMIGCGMLTTNTFARLPCL
jgi:2-phosphoglycerate kinase